MISWSTPSFFSLKAGSGAALIVATLRLTQSKKIPKRPMTDFINSRLDFDG